MIPVEAHLFLNHVPLIGLVFGLVFFVVGLMRASEPAVRAGLRIFLAMGIAALPVVGSGLVSATVLADATWLDADALSNHQLAGILTLVVLMGLGTLCAVALVASTRNGRAAPARVRAAVFLLAVTGLGASSWTGYLGGPLRHSELGRGAAQREGVRMSSLDDETQQLLKQTQAAGTVPVIELRQYTLHPGKRDVLIDLFEREFIESQEALSMKIVGTFRDLDRPDRFVWIRGFDDMPSRAEGLTAFYGRPVWQRHRDAANATMIDSDNVLLLRAARPGSAFRRVNRPRPPRGAVEIPKGVVTATIYSFSTVIGPELLKFLTTGVEPELKAAGIRVLASYVTETSPNNFPRLPVRDKEHVFVWFASFVDPGDYERFLAALARSAAWSAIEASLKQQLAGSPEVLRLQPTPRSELRP